MWRVQVALKGLCWCRWCGSGARLWSGVWEYVWLVGWWLFVVGEGGGDDVVVYVLSSGAWLVGGFAVVVLMVWR